MADERKIATLVIRTEEEGADKARAAIGALGKEAATTEAAVDRFSQTAGREVSTAMRSMASATAHAQAALDKQRQMLESAFAPAMRESAKITDTVGKATLSYQRQVERTQKALDPLYRAQTQLIETQKTLRRGFEQGLIGPERYAELMQLNQDRMVAFASSSGKATKALGAVNDNAKLSANQMQGLGFQVNDMATMLAMGASPFQIMASQAGQVVQSLGDHPGGVRGSLKAMGTQLVGVAASIGPVGLGLAAATTAAVGFAYAFRESFPDMEETLTAHEDLIGRISDKYDGLADKLKEVGQSGSIGLNIELGADVRNLEALIEREMRALDLDFTSYLGQAIFGAGNTAAAPTRAAFASIQEAVDEFRDGLKDGSADVEAFRRTLADMHREAGERGDVEMQKAVEAAFRYTDGLADHRLPRQVHRQVDDRGIAGSVSERRRHWVRRDDPGAAVPLVGARMMSAGRALHVALTAAAMLTVLCFVVV